MFTPEQILARLSRRNFLKTTTATALGVTTADLLAACGGPAAPSSVVTINHWDTFVSQSPWVDNEIKLFQQAHPGIKVKKTTQIGSTYNNIFALALKTGKQPDTFAIPGPDPLAMQVAHGVEMPLDKWATPQWKAKFPLGSFQEGTNVFKGKPYSVQFTSSAPFVQLYINEKVFKDAGIVDSGGNAKIPHTWDDVTHAAETITQKGNGNVYGFGFGAGDGAYWLAFILHVFVVGAGTPQGVFGADDRIGKFTYGSDRNYMDFINLLLEWRDKGYIYPNSMSTKDEVLRHYFETGKIGMIVNGVWAQPEFKADNFSAYSLSALISPDLPPKAYYGGQNAGSQYAISSKTKHPDEAWAWFDWLYSPEAGKRWVQMGEDSSIYPQNNDPKNSPTRQFQQFLATTKTTRIRPNAYLRNPNTAQVVLNGVSPDIGDVIQGIYTGQIKDKVGALQALDVRWTTERTRAIKAANDKGYKVSLADFTFPDWDPTQDYVQK